MSSCDLTNKHCVPCEGGVPALSKTEAQALLAQLDGWSLNDTATVISKTINFKGFMKTMMFVNAVAYIAQQEMHHPDLEVSYNKVVINFTTHAIHGLSENDFICAAKVDNLLSE